MIIIGIGLSYIIVFIITILMVIHVVISYCILDLL